MTTTTLIITIVVLLLVFGGGGYGYYSTRTVTGGPGPSVGFNPTYGIGGVVVTLIVLWALFHYVVHLV